MRHTHMHSRSPIADVLECVCGLIEGGAQIGKDLLTCFCDIEKPQCGPFKLPLCLPLCGPLLKLPLSCLESCFDLSSLLPSACATPFKSDCDCRIPPPCWMPQMLGTVDSRTMPGGTAAVRLRVVNCTASARTITVESAGVGVTIDPASLTLGPMERRVVLAKLALPADVPSGEQREVLVWVKGCREHVLRWIVTASHHASDPCNEIVVEDCHDYVHHWYDHFYCDRPCRQTGA